MNLFLSSLFGSIDLCVYFRGCFVGGFMEILVFRPLIMLLTEFASLSAAKVDTEKNPVHNAVKPNQLIYVKYMG